MESYMTRDDSGGEGPYETQRRQSPRSLYSVTSSGSSQLSLVSPLSVKSTKSSIRFVNSAAFIENDDEEDAPDNNSPFEGFSERNFTTHRVSPTEIVPPLNLGLHEDNQSKDYSYSYRKNVLAAKVKPDEAYQTWLEAKRKLLADQAKLRLKEQQEKQRREEERKQIAEQKFKEWYARKASEVPRKISMPPDKGSTISRPVVAKTHRSTVSDEEARAKLEEWNRRKAAEEERRRLMKVREEERRRAYEQQRQEASQEAWLKWLAESRQKPKPVPLCCGINTLRGTVSDIFVNPNEWVAVFGDDEDE